MEAERKRLQDAVAPYSDKASKINLCRCSPPPPSRYRTISATKAHTIPKRRVSVFLA